MDACYPAAGTSPSPVRPFHPFRVNVEDLTELILLQRVQEALYDL